MNLCMPKSTNTFAPSEFNWVGGLLCYYCELSQTVGFIMYWLISMCETSKQYNFTYRIYMLITIVNLNHNAYFVHVYPVRQNDT